MEEKEVFSREIESILNYVDINSDAEMLVYGISIILINIGMYFIAPAFLIIRFKRK